VVAVAVHTLAVAVVSVAEAAFMAAAVSGEIQVYVAVAFVAGVAFMAVAVSGEIQVYAAVAFVAGIVSVVHIPIAEQLACVEAPTEMARHIEVAQHTEAARLTVVA
jgi:hypothetical protein